MLSGGIIEGLEGLGLRPALLEILSIIAVNPGISASAAGQAAGVKQPNVGKLIRELLDKNFIERRPSASDRRATELAITPSGDALVAKAHQLVREHQDRTMAPLSQDESKLLINLLSRL